MAKCEHEWGKRRKDCKFVCKKCKAKKVNHQYIEIMDNNIPLAKYVECRYCGKTKENTQGPNRPPSDVTMLVIKNMLKDFRKRLRICSYMQGNNEKRVYFAYPDEINIAIAEVLNRSVEQVDYLMAVAGRSESDKP